METMLEPPIATSVVPKPRGRSTAPRPRRFNRILVPIGVPNFFLNLRDDVDLSSHLRMERLERAIGVIYRPETELVSHYFHARLSDQFDAIMHYDHTRAAEPLERAAEWETGEVEETFPSGRLNP